MQMGLIKGVLQRQKYTDIAKGLNCSEGYIKDVGYELWRLLSDIFEEEVNKSNLQSTLFRHKIINSFNFKISGNDNNNMINSIQLCSSPQESDDFLRGKQEAKNEAVIRSRAIGLSDTQICECLDMTIEDIQKLRNKES
ncbi:MAG: hypothetical protein SAJ12_08530 [Jaaginema sp. PMC 1079.18]|nr:hypothetical protein [Jaaginema sp. PMC 1080.18]MEC4851044.1 hypothetical protein [Jaaginema sp. PMC 1079.18]MEC4866045.1 hypothetical protein [Jaaginema sp. PMC 1078.18]